MAIEPYAPCPCGSGKKFKWCCQPIHMQMAKAFEQEADGQHATALRLIEEVVTAHPDNPEAWGRKAQLLYQNDRVDEAEKALTKALELNPKYPFGHFLRGRFRHFEGEIRGALLQYRKAAEFYDPEAKSTLGMVYFLISECELALNNPVAARAAGQIALHLDPSNPDFGNYLQHEFGERSHLPLSGRCEYKLQPLVGGSAENRTAWEKALGRAATGQLADAVKAFESLAIQDEQNAAAWYNLALTRAWLGQNAAAVEALDRYVALENDESKAAAAWALAEVLRCGQGMEDQADYVDHSALAIIRDGQTFSHFLEELFHQQRFIPGQRPTEENPSTISGLILESLPPLTAELAVRRSPHIGATMLVHGNLLRLFNVQRDRLLQIVEEMRQKLGPSLTDLQFLRGPAPFGNILNEALVFPINAANQEEFNQRTDEGLRGFFEETWLHRPLGSLGNLAPLDAAGHAHLRKKVLGVIRFYQECLAPHRGQFDFEKLKNKLGLTTTAAVAAPLEISAMSAAELAALSLDNLSDQQVEDAYQAALHLDARELASRFAKTLVTRPPRPDKPDRFPWFNHLIQFSLAENNYTAALGYVDEGEKDDFQCNEGRRHNDYGLRRGLIHLRSSNPDQAQVVFEQLIVGAPDELRFRSSAAEAMLSARQGARALRFAEEGLALARKQNNRDSEQHFLELVSAAKRQAEG